MKASYRTASGQITFEVEGENAKALFRELASLQEVFDAERSCGVCHGTEIRLLARKVEDYDYYELGCQAAGCRARFAFGQARKGGALFPKRKDEDGNRLPNGGWSKWEPQAAETAGRAQVPEEEKYIPEHQPPPRSAPSPAPSDTPFGLQPSFDRLGVLFGKPAPTRIGPALDLIREQMHRAAGNAGTAEFDRLYRKFESGPGKSDVAIIKLLLRDLVGALERLKDEVHH